MDSSVSRISIEKQPGWFRCPYMDGAGTAHHPRVGFKFDVRDALPYELTSFKHLGSTSSSSTDVCSDLSRVLVYVPVLYRI